MLIKIGNYVVQYTWHIFIKGVFFKTIDLKIEINNSRKHIG